jgi:mono/diheme cytochrome c family protein
MLARAPLLLAAAALLRAPLPAQDARALFLQHCASCHGETGDGHGTAALDRPARSFKDGGFSHGNTVEAIVRTLTFGIPGTPMPAAPSVLTEAQRTALAEYVISLGPPPDPVVATDTVLRVADRPVIVRGKLPPIAPGLPERVRGLLVGLPAGLAFEYRVDDARLLGVRQGGFVQRDDWLGRGGDPLKPLGGLIWISGSGDPGAIFRAAETNADLKARLRSTSVESGRPVIAYELVDEAARPIGLVRESPAAVRGSAGSGFSRRFEIQTAALLRWRAAEAGPALVAAGLTWTVRRRADGSYEAISARGLASGEVLVPNEGALEAVLRPDPRGPRSVELSVVLSATWDDAQQARWLAETAP